MTTDADRLRLAHRVLETWTIMAYVGALVWAWSEVGLSATFAIVVAAETVVTALILGMMWLVFKADGQ